MDDPDHRVEDAADSAMGELKRRSAPIAFTYTLSFLENLAELSYPWAIGIAVNGLLIGDSSLVWPLVAIWLAHIIVGAARQIYDTRLFSALAAAMALKTVRDQRAYGAPVSEVSARIEMLEELIDFLEEDAPVLMEMLVGLVGSLVFLTLYDASSGAIMLALMVPVLALNAVMGVRAFRSNVALNTQWEKQVQAISDKRPRRWRLHFGRMAQWRIRLSDLDAATWSISQLLVLVAVVIVLYRTATAPEALAGTVVAIIAYALRIEAGIDEIPSIVHKLGRLIDIRRRIAHDT